MTFAYPVKVTPLENYKLEIIFDNAEKKIFDVLPYLKDSFWSSLVDVDLFKTVKPTEISVEWANGVDICPEELYCNSKLIT